MNSLLMNAYDPEEFRKRAHQVVDFLADQLESARTGELKQALPWVARSAALAEIEDWFNQDPGQRTEIFSNLFSRAIRLHHPHYLGHQISPTVPIAAIAGLVSDFLNNGMGVYEMGIAGTAIERFVIKTVAKQFGMDDTADGVLTSGGTLGNLTALLAARSAKAETNVWEDGNQGQLAVLVSDQAHYCIDRAARVMGWGSDGTILVPTDDQFCMRTDQLDICLQTARSNGQTVIAVVGSACTTATGSFDNLREIAQFCQTNDLWFHVDGAHGAAAAYSHKFRDRVAGIEQADSVTMDFHKMLMTPALATAVVFKDANRGRAAFSHSVDYLWEEEQSDFDLARRTFECTKTMTGLKVFSMMATYGTELFDSNVTRLIESANEFATMILATDDFELAIAPQANIICYRYIGAGENSNENLDELNRKLRRMIVEDGTFYIVQTVLGETQWLRSTIANPFTTTEHFGVLLDKIRAFAATLI